jgi:PAS domain S-box-containing protein
MAVHPPLRFAARPEDEDAEVIGTSVGPHRVLDKLGEGGMGEVYLAEDARLHRQVALKILPAPFASDADRVRRFEQEARTVSALSHPNILTLFDLGRAGDRYFMATEFIDGRTLRAHLLEHGRLAAAEAIRIVLQCASALASAHAAGIVHRDVKPENLMLRRDSFVKVLDFGLAKVVESSRGDEETIEVQPNLTSVGIVVGTVGYLARQNQVFGLAESPREITLPPMGHQTGAEAHDQYRRLVESSPDGILIARDFRIEFLNPRAVHLLGASHPGEILGKSPLELFHTDSHGVIRERIERLLRGECQRPFEEKIVRIDGGVTDVEVSSTLLADPDGGAIQVIVRDITERKRSEALLRESEERLSLAFAGAQEGVWDWNVETGAVVYSQRWKQMLGYADDEIVPTVNAWERLLHPDDVPRAEALNDAVNRGQRTYEGEFRLRHKDGHYLTVLTRGLPIRRDDNGPVMRIVGTHLDITERKRTELALRESEERLTLAFAGAQEGIWDWNLETDAVVYSSRWKEMLGYSDEEIEPHISAWERLVHPDDRAAADQAHQNVARGQSTYEAEFRLRHKDGHYVRILSRGFPVRRDPGGRVVRIVGTHVDLTERGKHEAERARAELLAHLVFVQEDERRRIARDMHDQFGEQLTALSFRIALLKEACAQDAALAGHAEALESIAQRLDRDVDHLVWELRPTALDDLGLRAALTNYVQEWSQRANIAAELHTSGLLDDRLAPEVETALYRIAQEALTNVAKHSGARRVEVILERRSDCVLLILEDDGVGFEQSQSGAARQGFGLVGMQERAALVGASVQIESTPGKGTTIFVRMAVPTGLGQVAGHAR